MGREAAIGTTPMSSSSSEFLGGLTALLGKQASPARGLGASPRISLGPDSVGLRRLEIDVYPFSDARTVRATRPSPARPICTPTVRPPGSVTFTKRMLSELL